LFKKSLLTALLPKLNYLVFRARIDHLEQDIKVQYYFRTSRNSRLKNAAVKPMTKPLNTINVKLR